MWDSPAGARPGSYEHNRNGRGEVSDGQRGNAGGHLCWKGKIFAAGRPIVQPNGSLPQLSHSHQQTCAHTKHQATETILWALEPARSGRGIIMAVVLSAPVGASLWLDVVVGLVLAASLIITAELLVRYTAEPRKSSQNQPLLSPAPSGADMNSAGLFSHS
jgi:hypothetical protein